MKILELSCKYAKEFYNNNYQKMIIKNDGELYDDNRIRKAFNFGFGTIEDFKRYMENNKQYCRFYDIENKRYI